MKKRYILQKFVFADTVVEAISLDTVTRVENAWLDNDYKPEPEEQTNIFGFIYEEPKQIVSYSPLLKPKKRNAKPKKKNHK